jgi:hypothetical protein
VDSLNTRSVIMNRSRTGSKQKYAVRLELAKKLIAAYVKLQENDRETAERFLALQVYGDGGMYPYSAFPEDPWESQVPSFTDECPLFFWEKPWSNWAQEIRESSLNDFERREAVRAMLGALIRQKDRVRLTGLDLGEAARTTLGWTRWDAKKLASLRSFGWNSISEHRAWVQKLVDESGRRKEAGRSRPSTRRVRPGRHWMSGGCR